MAKKLNTPSANYLIPREHRIKAIQELYDAVKNGGGGGGGSIEDLTPAQKAALNSGITADKLNELETGVSGAVQTSSQSLTESQKSTARNNIGALGTNDVPPVPSGGWAAANDLSALDAYVHSLNTTPVVVGPKPETGTEGTIYRVPGDTTYTDWMYYNGTWSALATYDAATLESQFGYYKWTGTGNAIALTTSNQDAGSPIGSYDIKTGGSFKIKMTNAATGAATLSMNGKTATPLYYNGEAVSASNTWEAGEVISVYYDGTYYQASNAQGGGGKAEKIKYDNSQSGLAAENVQGAVDELGQREIIFDGSNKINYYTDKLGFVIIIDEEVVWISNNNKQKHKAIPVNGEKYVKITAGENKAYIAFATSSYTTPTSSSHREPVPVCDGTGRYSVPANGFKIFPIPDDCAYILIDITNDNTTFYTPQSVYIGYNLGSLANNIPNKIPFAVFEHIALKITNNQEIALQSRNVTDYIDISGMLSIIYTRACASGAGGDYGMLFYNENKEPISGYKEFINQAVSCYVIEKISVPDGAVYARFTYWNDERWGNFFIADGDRDAEAIALWQSKKDSDVLTGYEAGVYRQMDGTTDNGFQLNSLYGLGSMIPVAKGDTVLWHYGNAEIRTMALCVCDEEGQFVTTYNNNVAYERTITNFMSTGVLSQYYVRASMLIANGSDNYLEVNGKRVWTAMTDTVGNRLNKLDKAVFPDTDLTFYNKYINTSTGVEGDSTTRLSTSFIMHMGRLIISVGAGYLIRSVNYYDENKTWYKSTLYQTQSIITEQQEKPCYIKLVITNTDDTTDIALDAPINLTFNTYSGGSLDEFDDALRIGTFNSSYNNTDVEEVRNKYCGLIKGKSKIENFLFFTDPHLTPNSRYEEMTEAIRDKYISTLQKYYNSLPMDFCICGGDWLNFNHPSNTDCEWLGYCDAYMRKLFRNYYPVFGNHDNNPYTPSNTESNWLNALTYPTVMNLMFRENGRTYYSFEGLNTKFYVMNSGVSFIKGMTNSTYSRLVSNRWAQIEWLGNALLQDDADNSVIVLHIYSNASNPTNWFSTETGYRAYGIHDLGKNVKLLVTAYNNRQSITLNGITYNFANCNGRVMFIHCGHTHFDYVDTTGEIPIISTTNLEGGHLVNGEVVYDLVPTFDCCMNDIDNSALYMIRVGASVSRIVNYNPQNLSVGGSISLTCKLSGTITWQTRNSSIATISNGTVAGVASGCTGIIATNENGEEEYWIVKVG